MKKTIYRKQYFLLLMIVVLVVVLIARLADLQLMGGERYLEQAEENRFYSLPLVAPRGIITDRYGDLLVSNERLYYQVDNSQTLYSTQTRIEHDQALELMASGSAQVALSYQRQYVYPALSHVLGYVGAVTPSELAEDPQLELAQKTGKLGLERIYEHYLRGKNGRQVYEIDALARKRRLVQEIAALPGQNLGTTLDPYLSQVAAQAIGNQQGAVVIADAQTGQILSLISSPGFNGNVFSTQPKTESEKYGQQDQIRQYFGDVHNPFFNRAVAGSYPPGSIFKTVTALTGLAEGKITSQTTVLDEGVLKVGDYEYRNWYYRQYGLTDGQISLVRAIARSNDIYFYKVAEWVGPDKLAETARLMGFGKQTGIELSPEAQGLVPDPAWKELTIGEKWFLGNTYHFGIGQGDILVSPIQVIQLVQALANQGTMCPPRLIRDDSSNCQEVGINIDHLDLVLEGMIKACLPSGSASVLFPRNSRILANLTQGGQDQQSLSPQQQLQKGMLACKTGTAEFGEQDEKGNRKTHGWLIAIVEPQLDLADQLEQSSQASPSAQVAQSLELQELKKQWLAKVKEHGFPQRLVMAVLIESSQENPYPGGAEKGGPVVEKIVRWMES